jgi:hypothetical protein
MLRRVALVRTDVSEELSAFFIRVTRFVQVGTTLAVTSNRRTPRRNSIVPSSRILFTLMKEALSSFEPSVLTRAILYCKIPFQIFMILNHKHFIQRQTQLTFRAIK